MGLEISLHTEPELEGAIQPLPHDIWDTRAAGLRS